VYVMFLAPGVAGCDRYINVLCEAACRFSPKGMDSPINGRVMPNFR
jgi:hypothetical protein